MAFIDDCVRENLDAAATATLEAIEPDYLDGKADFAFGKMPQHPHDSNYMNGWIEALQQSARYEAGGVVHPEATYRAPRTSDRNALFTDVPLANSAWDGEDL
jgi:hypothetical protein